MDVAHQLQQVRILLAKYGLVPILELMTAAAVPQIEADGIAG